jgi:hypothetical protein
MDFSDNNIQRLIDNTQDHLELIAHSVFVVDHPDFVDKPIALIAQIYFPDGHLSYQQLYRLSSSTALDLGTQLLDHYQYTKDVDNT